MRIPLVRGSTTEHIDLVPSKIIGIGLNYRAHAAEMAKALPEEPLMFFKPRSAMIASGEPIERPSGYERVDFEGEPIVLLFATRWGSEALEVIFRFEEQDGRIARIRAYGFCPETIRAVGEALGVRVLTGLYRAPTPAPGASWPHPGRSGR